MVQNVASTSHSMADEKDKRQSALTMLVKTVLPASLLVLAICLAYIVLVMAGILPNHMSHPFEPTQSTAPPALPTRLITSTVRIGGSYASNGHLMPWTKHPYSHAHGAYGAAAAATSGIVVDRAKKLILTGDYIVKDAFRLYASSTTNTREVNAEVVLMAEEVHLALVRVDDDSFWEDFEHNMPALNFTTELPPVSTPVQMSGYFAGESAVAVQTGTVSQLQYGIASTELDLGRSEGVAGFYAKVHPEPDALFNPGPVFSLNNPEGPCLGFMALVVGRSFFIPGPTIHRMLHEYHTLGKWQGLVTLPALMRDMEAKPMRNFWGLESAEGSGEGKNKKIGQTGVMIRSIAPGSGLANVDVKKGDILVSIDGKPVHQDGKIPFSVGGHEFMFPLGASLTSKLTGDTVKLELLRPAPADPSSGVKAPVKPITVTVKLGTPNPLIRRLAGNGAQPGMSKPPSFFAVGGLVFTVLTQDLLEEIAAEKSQEVQMPSESLLQVLRRWRTDPEEEVVIFLRGMENQFNAHYQLNAMRVLTHFNGKPVKNLETLVREVGAVFTRSNKRVQKAKSDGTALDIGTGCGDGDFYEFTWLADGNKDTAGSPNGDPDLVLTALAATEHTMQGLGLWVAQYGALPVSADMLKVYSESFLGGQSVADIFGGPHKAASILPSYFAKSRAHSHGAGGKGAGEHSVMPASFFSKQETGISSSVSLLQRDSFDVITQSTSAHDAPMPTKMSSFLDMQIQNQDSTAFHLKRSRGYAFSPANGAPDIQTQHIVANLPESPPGPLYKWSKEASETFSLERHGVLDMDMLTEPATQFRGGQPGKAPVPSFLEISPPHEGKKDVEVSPHEQKPTRRESIQGRHAGRHVKNKDTKSVEEDEINVKHPSSPIDVISVKGRSSPVEQKTSSSSSPVEQKVGSPSSPVEHKGGNRLPMNNVVRIESVNREPSYTAPWVMTGQSPARCSGFILDVKARFILTCAHCVGDAEMLFVSREDFPERVMARVVEVAHDLDLAWLTAENTNGFWNNVELQSYPIFTGLPAFGSGVQVVGYPIGGTAITETKGVVARVDAMVYPNGLIAGFRNTPSNLLVFQVDAPINPGNSGGPTFNEHGQLLGVAFAGMASAQNVGYVIPNTVVQNFVNVVMKAGQQWVGQADISFLARPVQNPSMRAYLGLDSKDHRGVQLRTVSPLSELTKAGVRKTDVLVQVDGQNVTDMGKVSLTGGDDKFLPMVDLDALISQKERVNGAEVPLMPGQAIGQKELTGKADMPPGGMPGGTPGGMPGMVAQQGNGGVPDQQVVAMMPGGGSGGNSPGKLPAPEWSHPEMLNPAPTSFVFLRRECGKGGAKVSQIPVKANLVPLPPLVPRFDDQAVGINPAEIGIRKATELGFAVKPRYYAIGGLVWSVLSQPLFNVMQGKLPHATGLCMYRWKRAKAEDPENREFGGCGTETDEVVILLRGLDHTVNQHYSKELVRVLRYFNGEPVVSLKGLVEQTANALKAKTKYLSFTFESLDDGQDLAGGRADPDIVLDTKDVMKAEATGEILAAYGLQAPVSEDLIETYQKAFTVQKAQDPRMMQMPMPTQS